MEANGGSFGYRSCLVFIPVAALLLLAVAVGDLNPNGGGNYQGAWPDTAAVWIFLAIFLVLAWTLTRRAVPRFVEGRLFTAIVLLFSGAAIVAGILGLYLAANVSGFPSDIQQDTLWFSITSGLVLFGVIALVGGSFGKDLLASYAYVQSLSLGLLALGISLGIAFMLLLLPSGGVI